MRNRRGTRHDSPGATDFDTDSLRSTVSRRAAISELLRGLDVVFRLRHARTTFSLDAPGTREQFTVFLYRYAEHKGGGFAGLWAFRLKFEDVAAAMLMRCCPNSPN